MPKQGIIRNGQDRTNVAFRAAVVAASPHAMAPTPALATVEVVEIVDLVTKSKTSAISVGSTDSGAGKTSNANAERSSLRILILHVCPAVMTRRAKRLRLHSKSQDDRRRTKLMSTGGNPGV